MKTENPAVAPISNRKPLSGFTLIELLVVIAIMAILVALTIPVIGSFKKRSIVNRARAEMAQLQTAIDNYKATYGFYPPDSPNGPITNQLLYELTGTTNLMTPSSSQPDYQSIGSTNTISYADYNGVLGVTGFMNCDKPGEDTRPAKNFFLNIPSTDIATSGGARVLATSVGGPLAAYRPMPGFTMTDGGNANPWRYNSSHPQNNPGGYDLWVNIVFRPGETNLVCNWNARSQLNTQWP